MNPLPLALAILPRDPSPPESRVERHPASSTPGVLDHGGEGILLGQGSDFEVLVLHVPIVPVWEDGLKVLLEAASDGVAKHVIAQHVVKVIEAACSIHAVGKVLARLMVPVMEPATVELVRHLLFFFGKAWVVVLRLKVNMKIVLGDMKAYLGWWHVQESQRLARITVGGLIGGKVRDDTIFFGENRYSHHL